MDLDTAGLALLLVDLVAVGGLFVYAWLELRRQTTDIGRVGGVLALAALAFVLYFIGRALLGI